MKLTELLYPFAFLPVCLLLYYVLPKRCRNVILLAASLLFFAWGTPEYLVLLVLAILLNYFAGLELESLLEDGKTGHAWFWCCRRLLTCAHCCFSNITARPRRP